MILNRIINGRYNKAEMHGASPLIGFSSRGVDVVLDPLHDHLQGHQILAALQDDDVRKFPAGLHVLLVHGLHCGEVLGDYGLEGAATFLHVPQGRRRMRTSASVSTKILMSNMSRRVGFWKIRIPSTMMTLVGTISTVWSVRL